ncbi:1487_t:CDS:2 [Scutellospora calospora]|uniref:1487_t:CDS:1 n=1 Tax=Scutellospora calospora TaxID=85575 RepID=A0ACA9K3H3_9GLOM|nr:1487_t:CDS:2 [Scutellospora calospora]
MGSKFDSYGDNVKLSNADVVIQVGEKPDIKTFLAHSDILRKKSPYFRTALSNTWAKREGENIILKKPNISPKLSHHDGSVVLDILVAADELLIENDLLSSIQDHLIHDKFVWLQDHFALVLHTVFERDAYILPQNLNNDIITFLDSKCLPTSILPPRYPIVSINSNIILPHQALKIPEWIIHTNRWQYTKESFLFSFGNRGNIIDAKLSKVQPGNEAIYDDPSFGPCFGKTDLDMRRQFNEDYNCSAKKRCYKHTIVNSTKFAVEDYEVFQVFCHMVSSG